jgi:hypothetical protein
VEFGWQVPQLTVRGCPQESMSVAVPQSLRGSLEEQSAASLSRAVQPHTFAIPPPPQLEGEAQLPQDALRERPQLSSAATPPQFFPSRRQEDPSVSGVQQVPVTGPSPHTWGWLQLPHPTVRDRSQLSKSVTVPQVLPRRWQKERSDSGVQVPDPQTLGVPPAPQLMPAAQVPHSTRPPQPSETAPQFLPSREQKLAGSGGVEQGEPHTPGVPAPPQVSGAAHDPHTTDRAAPQLSGALTGPQLFPCRAQKAALDSVAHC